MTNNQVTAVFTNGSELVIPLDLHDMLTVFNSVCF